MCKGQCSFFSAWHNSSRTISSVLCVSSDTLLLLAMGGNDAVMNSLHPCFGVYEVSIVCITLHPLLRVGPSPPHLAWCHQLLPHCPSFKELSLDWEASWVTLRVPDSQRVFRKQIHVVSTSRATICWPTVSVCSSTQPPAPFLTLGWATVWLQTCRWVRSVLLVPVTAALIQWMLGNINLTSLVTWIRFGFPKGGPGPFSEDP